MANLVDAILFCPASNAGGIYADVAPNNVDASNDAEPRFKVGGLFFDNKTGRKYMYVKFNYGVGAVAAVAKNLAYVHTAAAWDPSNGLAQVTSDQSDSLGGGTASTSIVAGVFVNAPTTGNYCFIQVGGLVIGMNIAAGGVAANALVSSATDGRAGVTVAADISESFARALTATY